MPKLKSAKILITDNENFSETTKIPDKVNIGSIDLNVTHGCNMACKYCYGSYGGNPSWIGNKYRYGSQQGKMSKETAEKSIQFLIKESGNIKNLSVIFFGGEPLMNIELIKHMINYCRQQEKEYDKKFNLSFATNGTLLTEKLLNYFLENNINIQISIDGSKAIHDIQRCFSNGEGTYDTICM